MICDLRRSPFDDLASIIGRSGKLSWTSEEIGQTKTVVKSLNSSACTITPGRGRPNSLGTTISTMSPRFTSTRSSRRPLRSRRRWRHSPGVAPSAWLAGEGLHGPWGRANPEPNAARVAALMHADARGVQPSAGAGCEANCSGSSLVWWPCGERNMLRRRVNHVMPSTGGLGNDGDAPLICPKRQSASQNATARPAPPSATCAWGCFRVFARSSRKRPDGPDLVMPWAVGAARLSYPPSARQ